MRQRLSALRQRPELRAALAQVGQVRRYAMTRNDIY
jgi:hypothetical protein